MALTKLKPGQLAITVGRDITDNNPPKIKFVTDGAKIKMTIEVSFTPDQYNPDDAAGDINIAPGIGTCGVIDTVTDVFDPTRTISFRFSYITGEKVTMTTPEIVTLGLKGNHAG